MAMMLMFAWLLSMVILSFALGHVVETKQCLPCRLARPYVLWDDTESTTAQQLHENMESSASSLHCLTEGPGYQASYALPEWFVRAHSDKIHESTKEVCLPGATVKVTGPYGEGEVVMNQNDTDLASIFNNNDRQLLARDSSVRFGAQRLLAVHISTQTEVPDVTAADMQMALFGTGYGTLRPGSATVVEQIQLITKGHLLYTAASGPNIEDGMLEVKLPKLSVAGEDIFRVIPMALTKTVEALDGTSLADVADRVLFCFPSDTLKSGSSWRAFTYLFGPYSYYQAATCSLLAVLVHELGHGMGFQHSGKGDNVYGDLTCYMGGWSGPRMAYNGHKHWISGWYGPAAIEVEPQLQQHSIRRLMGFVDYNISNYGCLGEHDGVVVRAGNLYLQYNQAKGCNIDTRYRDTVTITEAKQNNVVSNAVAALSTGDVFTYTNYNEDGHSLIVEVCVIFAEHALINLYLSANGPQYACVSGSPSTSPSHAPTNAPSASPTSLDPNATTALLSLPPSSSPGPCGQSMPNTPEAKKGRLSHVKVLVRNHPWLAAGMIVSLLAMICLCFGRHCCCCCCRASRKNANYLA